LPRYKYKARNQDGMVVTGIAEADNPELLKAGLRERGIWLIRATEQRNIWGLSLTPNDRISHMELVLFTKEMGVMLDAGLSLLAALSSLQETASQSLKAVLTRIMEEVRAGQPYSKALALFPRIFSPFYLGMMEVGEAGGLLGQMHTKLASHLEEELDLKNKVIAASIYPAMVFAATFIGVCIMLIFAFPRIASVYKKNNATLPLLTQLMLGISSFLTKQWYIPVAFIALLLILFLVVKIHRRPKVKDLLDRITLGLPLYGRFIHHVMLARLTYNLSLLLNSGVPLLQSLDILMDILDNVVVKEHVAGIISSVRKGLGISNYLKQNPFFPPLLVSMIRTGEESGSLAEMMKKASDFYEKDVEAALHRFTTLLEPFLILFAAGSVFLVLLAFYLPMFKMIQVVSGH
jgi:type IV pilus assembly protein PilC